MGKLHLNDYRYNVLSKLPKNRNGTVRFKNKKTNVRYLLTVVNLDGLYVRVLYKYYKNMLGELCVSFDEFML